MIGTRVKVINYPFTGQGVYPIGGTGVVTRVYEEPGVGYFDVKLDDGGTIYCDGLVTVRGDEIEVLPITSPDAAEAASGAHKGDDGLAGVGAR